MRFSIQWLLAATAYIALATAAIASGNFVLSELTAAVTLVALCVALITVCFARRRRQAMALGFVILATAHLASLYLLPTQTPLTRAFAAAGYIVDDDGSVYTPAQAIQDGSVRFWVGQTTIHTVNAMVTLAAGLLGCLAGWLAYRFAIEPSREE